MKIEILKKSHLKRNIIIGVIAVLIISAIILNFTRAKYRVTQSIPLVNGTINYSLADFNAVAIYVNGDNGYTKTDTIPDGYVLNESESYCTINGEEDTNISLSYDTSTKSLSVTPMTTKGTKCYLYFDEKGITNIQELIASKNLATRTDFSTTLTEDTTGTIYYEDTSKGRTYYFAGNPTDNWVQFGGFYWRIIRINEDGSLRLIYSGNESSGPAEKGIYTRIGTSVFNDKYNDNAYIGYMFGTPKSDTYEKTHMNINDSTIKKVLDEWYQNNLLQYANKVDGNAGFCGDRTSSTNNNSIDNQGGKSKDTTYYGSHIRYYGQSNGRPTYECRDSDLYTLVGSSGGNKSLNYPIGLISMDEVWYAGGYQTINKNYYLCSGESYYTMSPNYYQLGGGEAIIFAIGPDGNLSHHSVFPSDTGMSIRPVINLCSDVIISSGTGTITAPYIIS